MAQQLSLVEFHLRTIHVAQALESQTVVLRSTNRVGPTQLFSTGRPVQPEEAANTTVPYYGLPTFYKFVLGICARRVNPFAVVPLRCLRSSYIKRLADEHRRQNGVRDDGR